MRLGAVFPTCEIGNDPAVLRDYAQTAEDLGYDRLVLFDHVLGAPHEGRTPPLTGPYTDADPFHEPMVLLGYLAAVTSRITLETGVLVLPQRQTALVAKQAAEIDLLSGGRLVLGVGTGWNHVEYDALGQPFGERGAHLEEQVHLLRRLWTEPVVSFEGRFDRIDRASIAPRPARPVPLWFGGTAPAALRRSARLGEGHIFGGAGDTTRAMAAALQGYVSEAGRAADDVPMEEIVDYGIGADGWVREAATWEAAGGAVLTLRTMTTPWKKPRVPPSGITTPGGHIAALETFACAVQG